MLSMSMNSPEIRKTFLKFFEDRGHKIVPSSSLIPTDITMLLTTAGMVQFKPFFLGEERPTYTKAASVQKCFRTTDIGEVGKTPRHFTFFEMLGNFSFGDYYKKEAIAWAWELITEVFKIEKNRLYITVFTDDDEALQIWQANGVDRERIFKLGEKTNFWDAGPTGPRGPCTEIMYDRGEEYGCGEPECDIECECGRYLEIWNLVFMQYDRDEQGVITPLKSRGVDTGMGLERLASVLQGVDTAFETDLLMPILKKVSEVVGIDYGLDNNKDVSLRIITDHLRSATFLLADGVIPSNEARGYVLRRILRRAARHGRLLGQEEPLAEQIIPLIIELMGGMYPELEENKKHIIDIAVEEERKFSETLRVGTELLQKVMDDLEGKSSELPGDTVFKLHDTFGFPLELTQEIADEYGFTVDLKGYEELLGEQKKKSAGEMFKRKGGLPAEVGEKLRALGSSEFKGYSEDETDCKILALLENNKLIEQAAEGMEITVFIDETPFYAESGGQIGDQGKIVSPTGEIRIISVTEPQPGLRLHNGVVAKGRIESGQAAKAIVDSRWRREVAAAHTATHLLQWALRANLGSHIRQAGSLVEPGRFRFDFTQNKPLDKELLKRIEQQINNKIYGAEPVKAYITSIDEAKSSGAIALFGEKYGDFVRVVEIGNISKELCGGTHAHNTADIGVMVITAESSVGANLRRIEALTGIKAVNYLNQKRTLLAAAAGEVDTIEEQLPKRLTEILSDLKVLNRKAARLENKLRRIEVQDLLKNKELYGNVTVLTAQVEADDFEGLRSYMDILKEKERSGVFVLGAVVDGKALLAASVTQDLIAGGLGAGEIIKEIAGEIGGGGGGRPDMAQAGGKDPDGLRRAIDKAKEVIKNRAKVTL